MSTGIIKEIFTGKVTTYGDNREENKLDQEWETAAFKTPITESIFLDTLGLKGDEQADKKHHGGVDKALFVYARKHYEDWSVELGKEVKPGANGENISVVGMDESLVCIGDVYMLGKAQIEITQPRRPCWKPARRLRDVEFAKKVEATGRTGWYFKVLVPGEIKPGDTFILLERKYPNWTIEKINDVLYKYTDNIGLMERLCDVEILPTSFRELFTKRLKGEQVDDTRRHYGPNI